MEKNILKKRAILYLTIIYVFLFLGWLLIIVFPKGYTLIWLLFSIFPVIATIITRKVTKDKSPWLLKPKFLKNIKIYFLASLIPGALIFLGGVLFFIMFPKDLDLSGRYIVENYSKFGAPSTLHLTANTIILIGALFIFISPLVIPVHIFALGEEIGWRGYLLPILLQLMSKRKAVLLQGVLWGLAHGVLIFNGFNYGTNYFGAPYTGILMMILVCIVLGIWLSYVTIKSNSIIPATILHGASNVIGEMPIMVSFLSVSPLLGPNPTGIIGMSGLIIGASIILIKLK